MLFILLLFFTTADIYAGYNLTDKRPKLVIIIDDIATPKQLNRVLKIPLKITPSIFPPSKNLKLTSIMTKDLEHYMIHLPVQAPNYPRSTMPNTLTISDSRSKIVKRVKDLRRWFPMAIYINNHTGSTFTSDYKALYKLYGILKDHGFIFVDSRTSIKSQGKKVSRAYGDFYLHSDHFIDNIKQDGAILRELRRAISKAKRKGYAIVIGHPHSVTIRTINNSLDTLKSADVIYMDELHKFTQ